jgi:hypothetical protein
MLMQQLNRSDASKAFISCRNIAGATISAGVPVEWDVATVSDGNSVTLAKSGSLAALFAGITDAAMADSAYGLVQVYGYRTSAYASPASAGCAPGVNLIPAGGILTDLTLSAASVSGAHHVTLMETTTTSATQQVRVFIRAM